MSGPYSNQQLDCTTQNTSIQKRTSGTTMQLAVTVVLKSISFQASPSLQNSRCFGCRSLQAKAMQK
jgi:hypothetical protein